MRRTAVVAAWLAWASVGTIVIAVEGIDRALRYAPGRRIASAIYVKMAH